MSDGKIRILKDLHTLLSHNVIGDKQYISRYKGFRGELDFLALLRSGGIEFVNGGMFVSRINRAKPYDRAAYFSVADERTMDDYRSIYRQISSVGFEKMYLATHDSDYENWERRDVMGFGAECAVPEFRIYEYDTGTGEFGPVDGNASVIADYYRDVEGQRGRNSYDIPVNTRDFHIRQLENFDREDILDMYTTRLIFDGYIGFGKIKGIAADIDVIILKDGNPVLCEVKEKDLSKRPPQGFGMDLHRIDDITHFSAETGLPSLYVVRHVDNQIDRKFVEWKMISMEDFCRHTKSSRVIEGGHGMRSEWSRNPTRVCPYRHFGDFDIKGLSN